jgi:predicted dinucleotide-binding enzyme
MSYAIVGFGKIGHALAKAFARKGIEVSVATTRDPESFASDAAAIGPTIIPKTLWRLADRHRRMALDIPHKSAPCSRRDRVGRYICP